MAIPAPNQLLAKDIEYRLNSAQVRMVVTTGDQDVVNSVNEAVKNCPGVEFKLCVNRKHDGWLDFDGQLDKFGKVFPRPKDHKVTDPMLMFFSSGTSGYP